MPDLDPTRPIHGRIHTLVPRPDDDSCPAWYFHVAYYPSLDEMRDAAFTYARRAAPGEADRDHYDVALAVTHTLPMREKYDRSARRWRDTTPRVGGVIRFSADWLTVETITHEALHATLHIERLYQWWRAHGNDEEAAADAQEQIKADAVVHWGNEEDVALLHGQMTMFLWGQAEDLRARGWAPPAHTLTSPGVDVMGDYGRG